MHIKLKKKPLDTGINLRIIFKIKRIFKKWDESVGCIHLAQERYQWCTPVNTTMDS
jgi:hypothetical protein